MSDLCVLEHAKEPDRPRRAVDGMYLCASDVEQLRRLIRDMPRRYGELGRLHGTRGGVVGPVTGSSSEPLPINPAVVDHRHQIKHDLVWWCMYVHDERAVTLPVSSEPAVTAAWLSKQVDWLAANRVAAEECLPVMQQLTGRAWAMINPDGRKRIKVGPCHACDGTLFATVRAEDDRRPSMIYCDTCELEKPSIEWLRFSKQYTRQMSA